MIGRALALFIFLTSFFSIAQETGENKLGSWHSYFGTNRISEKFSVHTEIQLRYYEQAKNFNQSVWRLALNYRLGANAVATIGYTNLVTDTTFEEITDQQKIREHHSYEDFILTNKLWEFNFQHRYRLEQRFIDFGDSNEIQHRIRYRLQLTLPLTDIFFLNFYEEVFLNFQNNTFDQNWSYAAIGAHVTNNLSVQAGYININVPNANFHRLAIGVTYNPDLREVFKKTKE